MTVTATLLETLIVKYTALLNAVPETELSVSPAPGKWTKKELVGHLIDSAQNNIRRFIVAQYEDDPLIVYNQDCWVAINNYHDWKASDLINLWHSLNRQVVTILKNISGAMSQRICLSEASHTIEWLAEDYIKHLQHHIHQVLDLKPVAFH